MEPTPRLIAQVRQKIGETVVPGGLASDTMFSDSEVSAWIDEATVLDQAVVDGWEAKLAHWSNLVDVTDGAASRALSDLMEHGQAMVKYYRSRVAAGPDSGLGGVNRGRTRIGKIVRNG